VSTWQRLLDGKSLGQRMLLQAGALAAALISIAGVVIGAGRLIDTARDRLTRTADPDGVVVVRSAEPSADAFVRQLVAADGGGPLKLDHKLYGRRGPADVTLEYDCRPSGRCSTTRVQAPEEQPADIDGGVWFQGCWVVTAHGVGYGAEPLDLQLRRQGATCEQVGS
jgi:hypothetical protein